ncbi:hypothetical protein ABZP36_017726 [Zizania latifolia]
MIETRRFVVSEPKELDDEANDPACLATMRLASRTTKGLRSGSVCAKRATFRGIIIAPTSGVPVALVTAIVGGSVPASMAVKKRLTDQIDVRDVGVTPDEAMVPPPTTVEAIIEEASAEGTEASAAEEATNMVTTNMVMGVVVSAAVVRVQVSRAPAVTWTMTPVSYPIMKELHRRTKEETMDLETIRATSRV